MSTEEFLIFISAYPLEDKLVLIKSRYDKDEDWVIHKEILTVNVNKPYHYEWNVDWYEGQEYDIIGYIDIEDVYIPKFIEYRRKKK